MKCLFKYAVKSITSLYLYGSSFYIYSDDLASLQLIGFQDELIVSGLLVIINFITICTKTGRHRFLLEIPRYFKSAVNIDYQSKTKQV